MDDGGWQKTKLDKPKLKEEQKKGQYGSREEGKGRRKWVRVGVKLKSSFYMKDNRGYVKEIMQSSQIDALPACTIDIIEGGGDWAVEPWYQVPLSFEWTNGTPNSEMIYMQASLSSHGLTDTASQDSSYFQRNKCQVNTKHHLLFIVGTSVALRIHKDTSEDSVLWKNWKIPDIGTVLQRHSMSKSPLS